MQIKPLQFGTVRIGFPVMLAPMAGYTDAAMRTLCLEHGAGAVYTELASSEGLCRDGGKTFQVLEPAPDEHPIAGHIFGANPERMAEAAKIVEQAGRFDWIDINCGCPVKKVVSRGAGAALLKDMVRLGKVVQAVKDAVSLPVSVKTRIGFNHDTADHLEIARVVQESGADLMAVHARMAKDFHGGPADWDRLGEMKAALRIPLIGNGGVDRPEDAVRMIETTGVDGVMIGRAAIGNCWIFSRIRSGGAEPTLPQRRDMMEEHLRRLIALNQQRQQQSDRPARHDPEETACIQFRTHIPYYVRGLFGKKQMLMKLAGLLTLDAVMTEMDALVEKNLTRSAEDA